MSCAVELTLGCDQGGRKPDQANRLVSKKATRAWEIAENAVRKLDDGAMQSTASLEKHAICLCCSLLLFFLVFPWFFFPCSLQWYGCESKCRWLHGKCYFPGVDLKKLKRLNQQWPCFRSALCLSFRFWRRGGVGGSTPQKCHCRFVLTDKKNEKEERKKEKRKKEKGSWQRKAKKFKYWTIFPLFTYLKNLKQNEAQSARAESTHKGVN